MPSKVLVSIGLPVRNGAEFLDEALRLLIQQTHENIEIVVSDNNSDDGSAEIIERFSSKDKRILVYRQSHTITALENFRFVFEKSRGDFFMWASCDDRRSADYIEKLLSKMINSPNASLVFGNVAEFKEGESWSKAIPYNYFFETKRDDINIDRLKRYTIINCLHIYGLVRTNALKSYLWIDIDNGPDIPLLVHLSYLGEFVKSDEGIFFYYVPAKPKTLEERALVNSLRRINAFPEVRLAWACARAANSAGKLTGKTIPRPHAFFLVYFNRLWRRVKPKIYKWSPKKAVQIYKKIFK